MKIFELFSDGLAAIFLHYGILAAIIGTGLSLELSSGQITGWFPKTKPFFARFQKDVLWLMLAVAFGMLMMWVGGNDMKKRYTSLEAATEVQVDTVVKHSVAPRHRLRLNGETFE